MISLSIKKRFHSPKRIAESLVENLKIYLVIKPLQKIWGMNYQDARIYELRSLSEGSVGKAYVKLLDQHRLKLIPLFLEHDLKHLILGYGMDSDEELKMQAYLLGNGNYSPFCVGFLSFGLLFPRLWGELYREYQKGKKAPSILNLKLKDCIKADLKALQLHYQSPSNLHCPGA